MRGLVQRVSSASVTVRPPGAPPGSDGELVGAIGPGLCVLVGVTHRDDADRARQLAEKLWHLRVFPDGDGAMNLSASSLADRGDRVGVLVVSQFTLYGDTRRGRRPSFVEAARPEVAEPVVDAMVEHLRILGSEVATGRFRTDMAVELVNDGPVTLMLEV
jgi:D-tyrosyl-tRNA(Tyr) deacylase